MATVHAASTKRSWLSRLLTTDFCPWANRFVYWLKEPIGWFALATAISAMIGLYFSPIGWTLAASLVAIMVVGMAWPWVAVRVTQCGLHPDADAVHEATPCRMVFSVRNRFPIPVWGLAIEGYLDCDVANQADEAVEKPKPTVGLACVPPLCTADYGVDVTPSLRGHYPIKRPHVACSFPFGIWTARRVLQEVKPLTVWPKLYSIDGVLPIVGQINADQGDGSRGGRSGDFVGVRPFRRGDSAKHVNWVASARSDALIVTERGGPQSVSLEVIIDTRVHSHRDFRSQGSAEIQTFAQESLNRRVRVAASVLSSLHRSRIKLRVRLGDRPLPYKMDGVGRRRMLDALAGVPVDGLACKMPVTVSRNACLVISGASNGDVLIRVHNPRGGRRAGGVNREIVIGMDQDLAESMAQVWTEVSDADAAA